MRLAVHTQVLDNLQQMSGGDFTEMVSGVALLDMIGVDGVVYRYGPDPTEDDTKNLELLRGVVKSHLNVEIGFGEKTHNKVMQIKPDQVTIVPGKNARRDHGVNVTDNSDELAGIISSLQAGGIDVSIMVAADISEIKEATNIQADYVTINASPFSHAKTAEDALMNLEEIETVALGASHLGLRVLIAKGVNHRTIGPLAAIESIEEAILDYALYGRALFLGLERAFAEVRDAIRWQGVSD